MFMLNAQSLPSMLPSTTQSDGRIVMMPKTKSDQTHTDVERATEEYGYSTFAWDRLGIAQSQHGEPVNEIQSALEVEALYTLTNQLREGQIPEIECQFDKVVHVGHSFGSIQSYSLVVLHPEASDGLILTGFTQATSFIPYFGLGGNFIGANGVKTFKDYPNGYLASSNPSGVHTNFFSPGDFAPELLDVGFMSGQPVTVGELLTIGAQTGLPNPLKGPVLIITGGKLMNSQADGWCNGHCREVQMGMEANLRKAVISRSVAETVPSPETHRCQTIWSCPGPTSQVRANSRLFWLASLDTG